MAAQSSVKKDGESDFGEDYYAGSGAAAADREALESRLVRMAARQGVREAIRKFRKELDATGNH